MEKCKSEIESWSCPNMLPLDGDDDLEYEHYRCEKCGRTMKLCYDDMK
jgi:hypothetical protein